MVHVYGAEQRWCHGDHGSYVKVPYVFVCHVVQELNVLTNNVRRSTNECHLCASEGKVMLFDEEQKRGRLLMKRRACWQDPRGGVLHGCQAEGGQEEEH
eukprot:CAMPEP_0174728340 /NCGR_PEP_ID=MMETSP1094-20130205/51543_1 /TAXON_ID=156173 /ORGANISM="Chrysochromulina brevifilum, Strain UTEX LB 985" /LENGTH=98 /DNA_ID=CAMNT_0015930237 /DNA_START=850 /DNA_END=1146 /DNA_ORIENTATION=-